MATGLQSRVFHLRDAPQLQPFLLSNVRPTGRRIGEGSYGTVEELVVEGLPCAGKKLHEIFQRDQDVAKLLDRFVEECSLLADLRHPHIVQFLGVCFLDGLGLPVLVMEYLPYNLHSLLDPEGDGGVKLPLAMKLSILYDVALGLNHMHAHKPPVIHRDLTARNILLTAAMTAKIADLGVARILNQRPHQQPVTMSRTPGTPTYMPPEALERNAKYNSAIDMFSFGHLALFTIVQDFPYPTPATVMDPNNPKKLVARSEVQRRSQQMEQLSRQLGGEKHPLVQLVTQCLDNNPSQRPTARQVLSQLEGMVTHTEDRYVHMSKLELIQALKRREGGEGEGALQAQVTQLQGQLQAQVVELEASRAETQQVQHQLQVKEEELKASKAETQQVQDSLKSRDQEIQELRAQLRRREAGTTELTRNTHQAQAQPPPSFKSWMRGTRNALFGTSVACAVVLNGKVCVGGGNADRGEDEFSIQVYDPESGEWSRLPECPVRWFAMAVVKQDLVLVGGCSRDSRDQKTLRVLDSTTQRWTTPYPNMHTARWSPTAIGYQELLVVAGGRRSGVSYLTSVEILNSSTKQWYLAAKLPTGCSCLTPALVGDTLYFLGGWSGRESANKKAFSISLPVLISNATSTSQAPPPTWDETDTKLMFASAACTNKSLLAVGGKDDRDRRSPAIHLCSPLTRQWTEVGVLPAALSRCSCVVLSSGELIVLGGEGEDGCRSDKVYIGTIN